MSLQNSTEKVLNITYKVFLRMADYTCCKINKMNTQERILQRVIANNRTHKENIQSWSPPAAAWNTAVHLNRELSQWGDSSPPLVCCPSFLFWNKFLLLGNITILILHAGMCKGSTKFGGPLERGKIGDLLLNDAGNRGGFFAMQLWWFSIAHPPEFSICSPKRWKSILLSYSPACKN